MLTSLLIFSNRSQLISASLPPLNPLFPCNPPPPHTTQPPIHPSVHYPASPHFHPSYHQQDLTEAVEQKTDGDQFQDIIITSFNPSHRVSSFHTCAVIPTFYRICSREAAAQRPSFFTRIISSFLPTSHEFPRASRCLWGTYRRSVMRLVSEQRLHLTCIRETSSNMAVVLQSLFDIIKTLPQ